MKECPNCKELLGDNVTSCFNCFYDFKLERIVSSAERTAMHEEEARRIKEEEEHAAALQKAKRKKESLIRQHLRNREHDMLISPPDIMLLNDTYEYDVVTLSCEETDCLKEILDTYSERGWRLVSLNCIPSGESNIEDDEISTSSEGMALKLSISTPENEIVMVFERRIYVANK